MCIASTVAFDFGLMGIFTSGYVLIIIQLRFNKAGYGIQSPTSGGSGGVFCAPLQAKDRRVTTGLRDRIVVRIDINFPYAADEAIL